MLAATLLVVSALVLPGLVPGGASRAPAGTGRTAAQSAGPPGAPAPSVPLRELLSAPLIAVPEAAADLALPGSTLAASGPDGPLAVLVTLSFTNSSALDALLAAINDPSSPDYHRYLSAAQFDAQFAPSPREYATVTGYFASFSGVTLTSYPDRLAVLVSAPPATAAVVFHTSLEALAWQGSVYWSPAAPPRLPAPIADRVASVAGLGTTPLAALPPLAAVSAGSAIAAPSDPRPAAASGYPAPVVNSLTGVQYVYPTDLQVAYDEQSLFGQYGFPRSTVVATLLWSGSYSGSDTLATCGTLSNGQAVGPYDPGDLSSFFNETLPTGQPHPTFFDVPLSGSPSPDCLASWDTTGQTPVNTAMLEALGAVAPGATVVTVSSEGPTAGHLDAALAAVLSPPSTVNASVSAALLNTSAVAVGWAAYDRQDSGWASELSQAEARGISIVAATGDSGDDPASAAWPGTRATFPASFATNTSGSLAVGGTTVILNTTTLHVQREIVWNVSASDTVDGGPAGSAGGISQITAEPGFQLNSLANAVLAGHGRGLPDVSAMANNSLVTLSIDSHRYLATNASVGSPFRTAHGTAVAAAIVTGLVGVIDHTLIAAGNPPLGFLDPALYALADEEYSPLPSGVTFNAIATGSYRSPLPTLPLRDVASGRNYAFPAAAGYDLASGWGSLDAYNYTMYVLTVPTAGVYGDLLGVRDRLNLTALNVYSTFPSGAADPTNASLQQNFFIANSLGAPVYWVQNVVFVSRVSHGWAMNFTAWIVFPFWGIYPNLSVYEYRWPSVGATESLPLALTISTVLVPGTSTTPPQLKFTFGAPGALQLTLNAPGAAYIIGRTPYAYSWQGTTYTNGPRINGSAPGFLAPQFVIVGGPGGGIGHFGQGTSGNLQAQVEPSGGFGFQSAATGLVYGTNTQTGETAEDLTFTVASSTSYTFAYLAGGSTQGIYQFEVPQFAVQFNQTGAPSTSTWFVNLSNGVKLTALGSSATITTTLANGTYGWKAGISVRHWSANRSSGTIVIAGRSVSIFLTFGPSTNSVTFEASGPVSGGLLAFVWYVNISGQPSHSGRSVSYTANLTYGTYSYKVASSNSSWAPSKPTGSFAIGKTPIVIKEKFAPYTYTLTLAFRLPSIPPQMTVTIGSHTRTGSFTTFLVHEPNGTYLFSIVVLTSGYHVSPSSGEFVVEGKGQQIVVTVSAAPPFGLFGLGVFGYVLVAVAGGVVAIWVAVFVWRRRRGRGVPPRAPPGSSRGGPPPRVPRAPSRASKPPPPAPKPVKRRKGDLGPDEI